MTPDFIITEKPSPAGTVYIVLPTHMSARNWLFPWAAEDEKRHLSIHLTDARFAQFKSDAALEDLSFKHTFTLGTDSDQ